jgi:hypothetical protein
MIDANKLLDLSKTDPQTGGTGAIKFGVVTAVNGSRPEIKFDGENAPSQKMYKKLASYAPAVADRVALMPAAGTYIILGKVD